MKYQHAIEQFEGVLRTGEEVKCEVKHYFAHGTYTRELHVPAGVMLTGKIHRHSCTNILVKGRMSVVTPEGWGEISAPCTFVSSPGVQKAAEVLEDSIFINVHPWDGESDLQAIEKAVIVPSYEALEQEKREMLT